MNKDLLTKEWIPVAAVADFPPNSGRAVLHGSQQIAVFNFNGTDWYATTNLCPHRQQNVLSRGLIGNQCDIRKVACPLHKQTFDLATGEHLGGNSDWQLETFDVQAKDGIVYLWLAPETSEAMSPMQIGEMG